MKTYRNYLLIIVAGCAISSLAIGLDARYRFIPQRFIYRAVRFWENIPAWIMPDFVADAALKPVRVEVERGVNLLLDPSDLVARNILITGVWQEPVWQWISDGLSDG